MNRIFQRGFAKGILLPVSTVAYFLFGSASIVVAAPQSSPADIAHNNAAIDRMLNSIDRAKAVSYTATITQLQLDAAHKATGYHTYVVDCKQDKSSYQIQTIRMGKDRIGVIAMGSIVCVFYDAKQNKFLKFTPPQSDEEANAIHGKLERFSDDNMIAGIYSSTLLSTPLSILSGQKNKSSRVISHTTFHNTAALQISHVTTGKGAPLIEDVYMGSSQNFLGYAISMDIDGKATTVVGFYFSSLKLLKAPLPLSTYQFALPSGATAFAQN